MRNPSQIQQQNRQTPQGSNQEDRQNFAQNQQQDRQDQQNSNMQDRQNYGQQQQQNRQNYASDYDDYHGGYYGGGYAATPYAAGVVTGAAIGSVLNATQFSGMSSSCGAMGINGVMYYQCGNTWYQQADQGGQSTYIVVNPPE